ncbi:MAG TPA: condensation domain-containing protein, partial [Longimicrobium sp.]|nr:condensation domain-containing protein [Longimicrobium sp.]
MTTLHELETVHELSPLQQGILFRALYEPASEAYFIQLACTLAGGLDPAAFRRAWDEAVSRHGALRSAFRWEELEKPLQIVFRAAEMPWREEDWRSLEPAERDARWQAHLEADRAGGFALHQAPLARAALIRTGDQEWRFAWSVHHLLLDGWSVPLVFRDVLGAYGAFAEGRAPALPRARPFVDYVTWLQGQDEAAAERFWRRRLRGFAAPTPVGGEAAAGAGARRQDEAALELPAGAAAGLRALAREHGVTAATA